MADLIMRPTSEEPGLYENDGEPYAVTRHPDGKSYRLIWDADPEPGDIVFKDAYISGIDYGYVSSPGVEVTNITIPVQEMSCPHCNQEYVNIGHPMKPGVIMQRRCGCIPVTTSPSPGLTVTVLTPPTRS